MASMKVRSRRDGAAIPLDETDKQLLNLMQGSFALVRQPFAHVAELAGLQEAEVMQRVQRLLDGRIIREITPIFDTRALGYSSMLVAAKVDAAQDFELALEPELNIVCYRHRPRNLQPGPTLDAHNRQLRQRVVEDGRFYIVGTQLPGGYYLRSSIMNPLTEPSDFDELLGHVRELCRV